MSRFVIALALVATPLVAQEVSVTLTATGLDLGGVEIVAGNDTGITSLAASGVKSARVAVGSAEFVSCRGVGVWCGRVALPEPEDATAVAIRVFRGATLRLPLILPRGDVIADEEFQVEIWLADPASSDPFGYRTFDHVESATWDGRALNWNGPATRSGYRVVAPGWASVYVPEDNILPGVNELAATEFQRGASLAGFVHDRGSGAPVAGARISVTAPWAWAMPGHEAKHSATSDDHGFFHVSGLDLEVQDIFIESEGRPPTYVQNVGFRAGIETRMDDIVLNDFHDLSVFITPATDGGEQWRIEARGFFDYQSVAVAADFTGAAVLEGLASGSYDLSVRNRRGDTVHEQKVDLQGSATLAVELDLIVATGQVLVDGEGVEAKVNLAGTVSDGVTFTTDLEGLYAELMPRPTDDAIFAQVETRTGLRREFYREPKIHDDEIELVFDLGSQTVRGHVLRASTLEPIAEASVTLGSAELPTDIEDMDDFFWLTTESDADGLFVFDGIAEGSYSVSAMNHGFMDANVVADSWPIRDDVEGDSRYVRLLLDSGQPLTVRLTTGQQPVAGAAVGLETRRDGQHSNGFGVTDAFGQTVISVPREDFQMASVTVQTSRLLWSGCAVLPAAGDEVLPIELPSEAPGTIVLRNSHDPSAANQPPSVLLTPAGGALTEGDFVNWLARHPDSMGILAGPLPAEMEVSGFAPGQYGVAKVQSSVAPSLELCERKPVGVPLGYLPPGGRLVLDFDFARPSGRHRDDTLNLDQ